MTVASPGQMRLVSLSVPEVCRDEPTRWSVEEQAEFLQSNQRLLNQMLAMQFEVLAAFDAAGGAQQLGSRSTAAWLRVVNRLDGPRAGAMVHTARALRDDLPATAAALAGGQISAEHVAAIRTGHRRLGTEFAGMEATVAQYARRFCPRDTRQLVDRLIEQYDREAADADVEAAYDRRRVSLSQTCGGWWSLDGFLDPATGEKLKAAFDVFADRAGEEDERSPDQRRNDALGEVADRALAVVDRVSGSGAVTITVTPEQLADGYGAVWPHGLTVSRVDLAVHTCAAHVTYVVGHPTADPIRWQVLAVGFAERYATPAQRRALAVRDGGCVHPGCTVRPERCIAHHIVHWADGGPTDLSNLVLLCDFHHREVHCDTLRIVMRDGLFTTVPGERAPP